MNKADIKATKQMIEFRENLIFEKKHQIEQLTSHVKNLKIQIKTLKKDLK